jgi:hypothetical protein
VKASTLCMIWSCRRSSFAGADCIVRWKICRLMRQAYSEQRCQGDHLSSTWPPKSAVFFLEDVMARARKSRSWKAQLWLSVFISGLSHLLGKLSR